MKIAFLGLGQMGAGMAATLLAAGHEVTVWNRSPEKATALVEKGARLASTPAEAAAGADAVHTMLADDAALDAVMAGPDGLLAGLGQGALHISHSTIAVATADRLALDHAARGQHFVSAPVFGRPHVAATGQLWVVCAGDADALRRADPLFATIGRETFTVGDSPSAANLVKLAGNFMIMASVEVLGEAIALAERGGVARADMLRVLTGTLFNGNFYQVYGPLVAEQRFRPAGFSAPLGLKDMRLAGDAADAVGAALPILDIVKAHLADTIANEGDDVDVAALVSSIGR